MLDIKDLSVSYQDRLALDTITLSLQGPTITGIIGPNGAGKSTLIKAITGLLPHKGQIYLDGRKSQECLKDMVYVAQKADIDFHFPITVKDCVSLGRYGQTKPWKGLSKKDWQVVDQALDLLQLSDLAQRQISQLSGGQFQRVLLARCLVQEAQVILLDEPFVGIDSVSERIIMDTLGQLKKQGKSILIVHHDLSKVTQYFDHLILLNKKLIAAGPTQETFTEANLRQAYGQGLYLQGGNS